MRLRSKSIGLLAGAILAVGSVAGAIAQEDEPVTSTAKTEATLLENTGAGSDGICSASVTEHDFGDFRWNGTKYVETSVGGFTGLFELQTTQTISPVPVFCDYTFSGTNLTLDDDMIAADEITLTDGVDGSSNSLSGPGTFTKQVDSGAGTAHTIAYDLEGALKNQTPGNYTGTVTVTTVGHTQPGE